MADTWSTALARHETVSDKLGAQLRESLQAFAETFAARSAALLDTLGERAAAMQAELAARDEARLGTHAAALDAIAASLQQHWEQAGAAPSPSRSRSVPPSAPPRARCLPPHRRSPAPPSTKSPAS